MSKEDLIKLAKIVKDYIPKRVIPGGEHGKSNGIPLSKFDKKQLSAGIKVEHEHTNRKDVAQEVAMDHILEIPDYYTRLDKMEKSAPKRKNIKVKD